MKSTKLWWPLEFGKGTHESTKLCSPLSWGYGLPHFDVAPRVGVMDFNCTTKGGEKRYLYRGRIVAVQGDQMDVRWDVEQQVEKHS